MIHTQVPIAAPSNGTIIPTFHSYTHARSTCLDGCAKKKKEGRYFIVGDVSTARFVCV